MVSRERVVQRWYSLVHVFLISCIILSCTGESTSPPPLPDIEYSFEDSLEAIHMAVLWDERLLPTESTTEALLYHLNYLRSMWRSSLELVDDQRFHPPWEIGVVIAGLDSIAAREFRDGEYSGFDSLNDSLIPDSIIVFQTVDIATCYYDDPYHPRRLCEIFEALPGIEYAVPSVPMFIDGAGSSATEDNFPIQFGLISGEWAFIFHDDWDLPHYYFKFISGEPDFLGMVTENSDSALLIEIEELRQQWMMKSGG